VAGADPDALGARLEKALQGQYRILRLLGRGGMGAVYLAREEALERLVAVKVLAGALDPDARERFRREARNGARLTHTGIVPLYSFGEADGLPYLVMGYVRGETLAARLRREGRIGPADARRILADVAEALDHAHRHGIVHRDVKPDNVMIDDESGRALLTDFGVAKASAGGQTVTQAGGLVGTPQYMSPEQVAGAADLDGRSDIYALGLTAYQMLCGRLPFEGPPQEALLRRLSHDAPPLRQAAPDVPDDVAAAVMRCLAREPPARWPDARAFRDAVAPVSLEEDDLPEPLDTLDGRAAFMMPFLLLCAFGLWGLWCHSVWVDGVLVPPTDRASGVFFVVGLAVTAFQIPTLLTSIRLARRRGFTAGQVATAVGRQPRWWLCLWYPRRLRRPGDVWDRLPRPFRIWRVLATVLAASLLPWMALTMYAGSQQVARARPYVQETLALELTLSWILVGTAALAAAVSQIPCARMLRSRGYDTYTLRRVAHALLVGPTSDRAAWKRPELVRLLLPARREGPPEPGSATEYAGAIAGLAARLGAGGHDVGPEAVALARRLQDDAQSLEREIARLAREADPAEIARLEARLQRAAGEKGESEDERRMRTLLEDQRDVLLRLQARLEEARARRDQRLQALRELWHGLSQLLAAPASGAEELTSRLRAQWAGLEAEPGPAAPHTLTRAR
jgi:predicted Ser/Thr protein kinase